MNVLRVIYQMARADFLERIRRFSFVVTLVITVISAYIFVPETGANYTTLDLGGHRGVYNSAWVGAQVAMLTCVFLTLFGFYLVRNSINRDRQTRVGQIIAATPVSKPVYTVGKWLSNFAVLAVIGAIVMVGAVALQLIRGEDTIIKPLYFLVPFTTLLLPAIGLVSAIAIVFECIPFLSGSLGNIVYFFIFPNMMVSEMLGGPKVLGVSYYIESMQAACRAAFPDYEKALNFGLNFHGGRIVLPQSFVWDGIPASLEYLLGRFLWLIIAIGIAMIASIPFNRFAAAGRKERAERTGPPRFARLRRVFGGGSEWIAGGADAAASSSVAGEHVHLTPLFGRRSHGRFGGILVATLRLALRSMPWWWYLGSIALIVCEITVPMEGVQQIVVPIALIWPVMIWAPLGNRELHHATQQIVFSAAHPLRRQLLAAWLTGVIVALVLVCGAGLRWQIIGDSHRVLAQDDEAIRSDLSLLVVHRAAKRSPRSGLRWQFQAGRRPWDDCGIHDLDNRLPRPGVLRGAPSVVCLIWFLSCGAPERLAPSG
ncbi:MAG: ABC transporter permease [candidate division Zixibacteria bacterium]|nr:ABC transporter permease [candidate division Zixibacteria bacterium]